MEACLTDSLLSCLCGWGWAGLLLNPYLFAFVLTLRLIVSRARSSCPEGKKGGAGKISFFSVSRFCVVCFLSEEEEDRKYWLCPPNTLQNRNKTWSARLEKSQQANQPHLHMCQPTSSFLSFGGLDRRMETEKIGKSRKMG